MIRSPVISPTRSNNINPQVSGNSTNSSSLNVTSNNLNSNAQLEICATSLKLPPFWVDHPEAWFIHVETQFNTKGITRDNTKYVYLIVSLPQDVIVSVIDVIRNPPDENRYLNLKTKLLERHSLSEQRKLDKLLSDSEIGDRKPSEFYRSLIQLAGNNINSDFVKSLWLRKLPRNLNIALVGSNVVNIEDLLKLADNIWEVTNKVELCTLEPKDSVQSNCRLDKTVDNLVKITSAMLDKFTQLSMEIADVKQSFQNSRSRTPFRNRSRSRGRSLNRKWLCRYHYRFGSKARRCEQPCSYETSQQEN
ncbi:uncharacterized protein LOC124420901 [Lucilia cuprina]|uniref:uncharacterized protein LOC124419630 n=1 Tax=Lucilia cuprina TaxID=7375 RepID=UPI001F05CB3C|nr:uncharacterized protein LOC124419630 [Lucilia cuprina]XP_046806274.1 uncharacterized protein LOC124419745 [Lucilia cuprina]XP_046811281.1 uncharacterized protein LOC124420901 [Lucilia cuprina]